MVPFLRRHVQSCVPDAVTTVGIGTELQKDPHTFEVAAQRRKQAAAASWSRQRAMHHYERADNGSQGRPTAIVWQVHIGPVLRRLHDLMKLSDSLREVNDPGVDGDTSRDGVSDPRLGDYPFL